ncbi:colicin immunity protein/pyocin immunity protein [Pseudomonas sp. M47T1]|uniref:bacteriocin immunity protein n=1 Tax=Pseudomonas sp. M47T1 TaxID=1179778 RepID=UPI000260781F|nr:bacteriocin immunity protein [Pseudomonas sp. M47T1]EIK97673.1 colicin immunity protein/pyocin immunity protein [Pseudomonas sp. M47T1]
MTDPLLKDSLSDYTEAEFTRLLEALAAEDLNGTTDDKADRLLLHFEKVSQHPSGSDLIYYPEPGADSSPLGVVRIVKQWRAANGLPGFKED